MPNYEFTLILSGVSDVTGEMESAVFEAGCDDALLGVQNGAVFLDFHRDADSPMNAIATAVADVTDAGFEIERIEPDDLVSAADIARRTNRSRTSIMQLRKGQRGPGGFPNPVTCARGRTPVWRWSSVADWFARHELIVQNDDVQYARTIAFVNAAIDISRITLPDRQSEVKEILRQLAVRGHSGWQVQVVSAAKKSTRRIRNGAK